MRYRGLALMLGSAVALLLLGSAVWLAMGVEGVSLLPSGSDEFQIRALTTSQVRFSYRLPRGQTWSAVYAHLSSQGWIIEDVTLLVWPDLLDDSRTSAVFWRYRWRHLVRQRLLIRRDTSDPRRFTLEMIQCFQIGSEAGCD